MGIFSRTSTEWLFAHCFQVELEFGNVGFCEEPGEKPSEHGEEPTTNSAHIWRQLRESNPGDTVGRGLLSSLRHPCSARLGLGIQLVLTCINLQ